MNEKLKEQMAKIKQSANARGYALLAEWLALFAIEDQLKAVGDLEYETYSED